MPVDLIHNVLRSGGREWPVSLDVRTGELTLDLQSRTYRLKPLTWGSKRIVARLMPLGEEVIRRYACLGCAVPPVWPDDELEAEALLDAALSITDPGGDGLPFSAATLLRVAEEVATGLRLQAGELDAQPAADVEALWRTLASAEPRTRDRSAVIRATPPRAESRSSRPPGNVGVVSPARMSDSLPTGDSWPPLAAGWSRIVVLPDEVPDTPEDTIPTPQPGIDDSESLAAGALEMPVPQVYPPGVPIEPLVADPQAANPAKPASSEAPKPEPVLPSAAVASPARPQLNRFRFRLGAEIVDALPARAETRGSSARATNEEKIPATLIPRSEAGAAHLNPLDSPSAIPHRERVLPRERVAEPEELLDAFAEQLEQAANAAGIDVEI